MDAVTRLRAALAPWPEGAHVELDDVGALVFYVRRDLVHLDADALNDRLHAWAARRARAALPLSEALVSFRHAQPVAPHEDAELDVQEGWLGLEPMFRLEEARRASDDDIHAFARLALEFLALVDGEGRPAGWRRIDEGNAE